MITATLYLICGGCAMWLGDRVQSKHKRAVVHYPATFVEGLGFVAVVYSMQFFH